MNTEKIYTGYFKSPIGNIEIVASNLGLIKVHFFNEKMQLGNENSIIKKTILQLNEYFDGKRKIFDLQLTPIGTAFQQNVWNNLKTILFGNTTTYQKQAIELGNIKAIRATATANGKNPIAIIIPCHRVIGTNGSLTGYAGELWRKQWLLQHEAKINGSWNELF